jgi:Zn finger protein HypA/HybF involved in hydrogenase expression
VNESFCETKAQLLSEYQKAAELYSKAVTELSNRVGVLNTVEYEKLRFAAERARKSTQEARQSFEVHTYEHRC